MSGIFDLPIEELICEEGEPVSAVSGEEKKSAEFLNAEEDELLRFVRGVRLNIVKKLTEQENTFVVPDKGTDKILLDQCLTALTDEQFKRAKGRKDIKSAENAGDWAEVLARTIMSRKTGARRAATANQRKLPSDIKVTDIKPGETDEGCNPLTMADLKR